MSDERLRRLQAAAAAGDQDAWQQLLRSLERLSEADRLEFVGDLQEFLGDLYDGVRDYLESAVQGLAAESFVAGWSQTDDPGLVLHAETDYGHAVGVDGELVRDRRGEFVGLHDASSLEVPEGFELSADFGGAVPVDEQQVEVYDAVLAATKSLAEDLLAPLLEWLVLAVAREQEWGGMEWTHVSVSGQVDAYQRRQPTFEDYALVADEEHMEWTAEELTAMPTLGQGQFSNRKVDTGTVRVWLSKMSVEDGMPYDDAVEVEVYDPEAGRWVLYDQYPG